MMFSLTCAVCVVRKAVLGGPAVVYRVGSGRGNFEGNGRYVVLIMIVYPASMKLMITG